MTISSIAVLVACFALPLAAAAVAALLRWGGAPGAAVLGGIAAGVIMGPTVFGRLAPDTYERLLVGGAAERTRLDDLRHRRDRDLAVARAAGADERDQVAQAAARNREIAEARRRLDAARWRWQQRLRLPADALAAIVLVLLAACGRGARPRPGLAAALSIGGWAAALPGGAVFLLLHLGLDHGATESALAAAAVAIGPGLLAPVDRRAAVRAEHGGPALVTQAGRVSTAIAVALAATALLGGLDRASPPTGAPSPAAGTPWLPAAALAAVALGWLLPAPPALRRVAARLLEIVLVPALAAAAAIKVDLILHAAFWPIVVALLASGDGRWIGATIGAVLPGGRRWLRTMRLTVGSMSCGATQLAVVAVAAHAWAIPERLTLALVAGALLIEITVPLRRTVVRELEEIEQGPATDA